MKYWFLFFIAGLVLINSCKKEYSFEGNENPSAGSLQSDGTGDCLPKIVEGFYIEGIALDGDSSYIEVQVDVTQGGSYSINTDTVNGIYFHNTGVFTTTGLNTVRLGSNGTPLVAGIHNFSVTYDSTECAIAVTTLPASAGGSAVFTLDGSPGTCMSFVVDGVYAVGTPLAGSNTASVNVNVITIGTYNISTAESNGMTFTGSGVFASTGPQVIVLNGTGIPTAAGNTSIPVTVGGSTCSFSIDVVDAATGTIDWKFTEGTPTFEGQVVDATLEDTTITTPVNATLTIFSFQGDNSTGDIIIFGLVDVAGGIQNNETYSTSATATNGAAFEFIGATQSYKADPTLSGVTLTFTVTNHNTTTRTIEGTFTGTVKDTANNTKTISNGTFKGTYP